MNGAYSDPDYDYYFLPSVPHFACPPPVHTSLLAMPSHPAVCTLSVFRGPQIGQVPCVSAGFALHSSFLLPSTFQIMMRSLLGEALPFRRGVLSQQGVCIFHSLA